MPTVQQRKCFSAVILIFYQQRALVVMIELIYRIVYTARDKVLYVDIQYIIHCTISFSVVNYKKEGKYPMSEILSAKTSTSKYDGNDVVMFNLADDPYELYNVWDQNKSLGEELAAEIVNAGRL